ncbi:MAG: hypothetical protein ACLR0P_08085 [Oscillospiraceae bacterium]
MKKRKLAVVSLLLSIAMLLSACAGNPSSGEGSSKDSKTPPSSSSGSAAEPESKPAAENTDRGENWVTDTPVTLKVWCMKQADIEDIATNEYIKWLQKETNVNLEFDQIAEAESLQKFNSVPRASGSGPDVHLSCNQLINMSATIMNSTLMKFGKAGVFLPLNDLIEQYGANTKKLFDDISYVKDGITMPDGNIYALPSYSEIYHCKYADKLWIDQSWLDNLKLEMPTTTDEYYEVLQRLLERAGRQREMGDPQRRDPAGRMHGTAELLIPPSSR